MVLLLLACGASADVHHGDVALADGDLTAAEDGYRAALARDPQSVDALYGLGWTYHLAGQEDSAKDTFEQLTRLHPESALGFKGLGSVAMAKGNLPLARANFQTALEHTPGDRKIRQSLGLLALQEGNATEALATFDALIAEDDTRPEFHQGRAEALLRLDRGEDALAAADRAHAVATEDRSRAAAALTRARALLAVSSGRIDKQNCQGTAPPVLAWLEAADESLDEVQASKVPIDELAPLRREVRRRKGNVDDLCPGLDGGG